MDNGEFGDVKVEEVGSDVGFRKAATMKGGRWG